MYSRLTAFGRLVRDPELKCVQGRDGKDVACCNITLACDDRAFNGETKTAFIDFTFWAGAAEAIAKYLSKGDPLLAVGAPRTETWEKDGDKRSKLKFRGLEFTFVPRGKTSEGVAAPPKSRRWSADSKSGSPRGRSLEPEYPDLSDPHGSVTDDLPF